MNCNQQKQNINPSDLYLVCVKSKTIVRHIGPTTSIYQVQPGQVLMDGESAQALTYDRSRAPH